MRHRSPGARDRWHPTTGMVDLGTRGSFGALRLLSMTHLSTHQDAPLDMTASIVRFSGGIPGRGGVVFVAVEVVD